MKFLEALYSDIDKDLFFLIWVFDGQRMKRSYWFKNWNDANELLIELKRKEVNVYCGAGLSSQDFGSDKRCRKNEIAGLIGFFADIDIKDDEAHKKGNLPKNISEAMEILKGFPYEPTITVHSGHGLQTWWLFKDVWLFEDDEDRERAENISKRLNYYFKSIAKQIGQKNGEPKGWDVDSVYNLDRVMRVPDTVNHKGTPVPVKVIGMNPESRYEPSDFDELLPDVSEFDKSEVNYQDKMIKGSLNLDSKANPPFDKFQALLEIEPKFLQSWERKRKDMQDQSASSYDLSLASYTAMAGWREQEIAELIIASRRKHKDDLKLREDYYKRTIGIAISQAKKFVADTQLEEISKDEIVGEKVTNDKKDAILETLSNMFGVRMIQIVKYLSEPPTYKLFTDKGDVNVGDVDNMITQSKLRVHLASTTGKYLPRFKGDKWDMIAQSLLNVVVEIELGEEATEAGQTSVWLNNYLYDNTVFDLDDLDDSDRADKVIVSKNPFIHNGSKYIFLESFKKWIRINEMERVTSKKLATLLRSIGCEGVKLGLKSSEGWSTRNVWKIE